MPTELEILALGWSESDWIPYRAALDGIFGGSAKVGLRPDIPKRLDLVDVLRVELLICRVPADPAQHVRFVKFLTRVVDGYPYLPVVVVGSTEAMSTAFHAVKAARYLPGGDVPKPSRP